MAQQDFGDSWTAHRNCHSEARISGQVEAEHAGVSNRKPTMRSLHLFMRKRQSSYSHSARSTPKGGVAKRDAVCLFIGTMVDADGRV